MAYVCTAVLHLVPLRLIFHRNFLRFTYTTALLLGLQWVWQARPRKQQTSRRYQSPTNPRPWNCSLGLSRRRSLFSCQRGRTGVCVGQGRVWPARIHHAQHLRAHWNQVWGGGVQLNRWGTCDIGFHFGSKKDWISRIKYSKNYRYFTGVFWTEVKP